ncbi:GPW/gp25 family protein [Sphingomonas sp.]|uniref:GPW/gp25 family protein n=1 Tax=Sphingomonas sp. TaxID=28214 RepID=UPI001B15FB56|nr:GPW/gp25 family protein [Sphingomonas sp.]MBO9713892.1 GPW/gp25 family protein [Sphingomonas sp.]
MTRMAYPFRPSASGRSVTVEDGSPEHVRQMLMLLILTIPGERVMRPDLGSPTLQMLFGAGNGAAAAALEATLAATITQQLGQYLHLQGLTVEFDEAEAALEVTVDYWLLQALEPGKLSLQRKLG